MSGHLVITVRLYGSLRWEDRRPGSRDEVALPHSPGLRVRDVLAALSILPEQCALAVLDGRVVDPDREVEDGAALPFSRPSPVVGFRISCRNSESDETARGELSIALAVAKALELSCLSGARFGAGGAGAGAVITGVNIMEVPEAVRWLRGGELLFTAGFAFKDSPEVRRSLPRALKDKGVAASAFSHQARLVPQWYPGRHNRVF